MKLEKEATGEPPRPAGRLHQRHQWLGMERMLLRMQLNRLPLAAQLQQVLIRQTAESTLTQRMLLR
ncbi:hypothetical protein D3C81_2252400 [compost metagenome]